MLQLNVLGTLIEYIIEHSDNILCVDSVPVPKTDALDVAADVYCYLRAYQGA